MRKSRCFGFIVTLAFCSLASARQDQPPDRILEIDVIPAADGDFARAFDFAQEAGMQAISMSLDWNTIDIGTDDTTDPPTPTYASDPDFLEIANACYPNSNTMVSLTLRPITTLTREVPPGFEDMPFDDPRMIDRFSRFLDEVIRRIPDLGLTSLVIGSEVDLYLVTAARRAEYLSFYSAVSAHARSAYAQAYPGRGPLEIAVEATFEALTSPETEAYYQQLNTFSDVIGVSYYPLTDGVVRSPDTVEKDFARLLTAYPEAPIFFYQLGYPSGYYSRSAYPELEAGEVEPSLGSSGIKQARFITEVFRGWDQHESIRLIDFSWLTDLSRSSVFDTVSNPSFGGTGDPSPDFVEFLRTLGLRTDVGPGDGLAGVDKPAFLRLLSEAAARGWVDSGLRFHCQ